MQLPTRSEPVHSIRKHGNFMNLVVEDIKAPDPVALRMDILRELEKSPHTSASLLEALPDSRNKVVMETPQRLSRFLGCMLSMGWVKSVKKSKGPMQWQILPAGLKKLK
jgi:hypothetical protein